MNIINKVEIQELVVMGIKRVLMSNLLQSHQSFKLCDDI